MSDDTITQDLSSLQSELLQKLTELSGRAGNITLQRSLEWDDQVYWPVRNSLVDAGKLQTGRGKGGSVQLVSMALDGELPAIASSVNQLVQANTTEDELYEPVAEVLRGDWARDSRFRRHHVEITARQGSRNTGGTWTRPDIVVAALRIYPYVPGKYFDVVTFEVKPHKALTVTAIYEALAHRRAGTHSYVWSQVPADYEANQEWIDRLARLAEEARRHGIGLIVSPDATDYSQWDTLVRAVRHEPDPELLNDFVTLQLSAIAREDFAAWFR